jgi:demethylmenaquinone methyltransferase / 2-methoxy-6-polyprenyl-1,4-benzoquinol methylase
MIKNQVKPYTQETGKKEQVELMFDNISNRYDLLNRFLSFGIDKGWRRKAIKAVALENPSKILDVATGTADLAIAIAKELPNSKITGVDISQGMLDKGVIKIKNLDLDDKIQLFQADSENLPFDQASFDAVTVAYGVRNFENLDKGLAEMNRILEPGGKIMILEFSNPTGFFRPFFQIYFKYILPMIGKWVSKDPKAYKYLFESVQDFPSGKNFLDLMSKAGFVDNMQQEFTFGVCSMYTGIKSK